MNKWETVLNHFQSRKWSPNGQKRGAGIILDFRDEEFMMGFYLPTGGGMSKIGRRLG